MGDSEPSTPRRAGRAELVVRGRYEMASIVNDVLIAVWFIAGSLMFFGEQTMRLGTWMFLLGSIELAIRPSIRLIRHLHLRRIRPAAPHESDHDF